MSRRATDDSGEPRRKAMRRDDSEIQYEEEDISIGKQCVVCNAKLQRGMAYFVLGCHIHAICRICLTPEMIQGDACLTCYNVRRQEELERRHVYESRNSLPIIYLAANRGLKEAPGSTKYKYPAIYPTPSIQSLSYAGHVKLPKKGWRCWSDYTTDCIIIGVLDNPTLTVVKPKYCPGKNMLDMSNVLLTNVGYTDNSDHDDTQEPREVSTDNVDDAGDSNMMRDVHPDTDNPYDTDNHPDNHADSDNYSDNHSNIDKNIDSNYSDDSANNSKRESDYLNGHYNTRTYTLSHGEEVLSGVCVKENLHLVCVGHGGDDYDEEDTSNYKVQLVYLDPTSPNSSPVHPIATLDVVNPVYVFSISKQLYGFLCMDGSGMPYTNGRIRILGLDTLLLAQDTDPCTIQSTAIWGRRTLLHLDLPFSDILDTVSVTPRGLYCVVSCDRCEARVYSRAGVYLYTLGERRGESDYPHPGRLYEPWSIHSTADNTLVISCEHGDVHGYNMCSNSGVMVRRRCVKDEDGDMLGYVDVNGDDENENDEDDKRWEYVYMNDPAGWRVWKGKEESVLHSVFTQTLRYAIDDYDWNKLHVYNIQP